jgi:hypothetical protein
MDPKKTGSGPLNDPRGKNPAPPSSKSDIDPGSSVASKKQTPHSHDRSPHWDELGRGTSKIPKGAAEILSSYFDARQVEKAGTYHSFFTNWRDLAGIDLAAHSCPRDIRNDTLIVDADHPGWVQMISMKKASILKNIRRFFPQLDIRDIRVLYQPDGSFAGSPSAVPKSTAPPPAVLPTVPLSQSDSPKPKPDSPLSATAGTNFTSPSDLPKPPDSSTDSASPVSPDDTDTEEKVGEEKKRLDAALKKLGEQIEKIGKKS